MKKIFNFVAVLTAISGLFFGCSDIEENVSKNEVNITKSFEDMPTSAKNCINILNLQTVAATDGLNTIAKYVDIADMTARSLLSGDIDIDDFISTLPENYTKLSRKCDSSDRSATNGEEEITLGDELNEIAEKFQSNFEKLIPDPTSALSLDYVNGTETGLVIDDDIEIPYDSIEGAMTVNILNAVANGESVENILSEIDEYIETFYECDEDSENARGVWKVEDNTWAKGIVNYYWGNISEGHKNAQLDILGEERINFG